MQTISGQKSFLLAKIMQKGTAEQKRQSRDLKDAYATIYMKNK